MEIKGLPERSAPPQTISSSSPYREAVTEEFVTLFLSQLFKDVFKPGLSQVPSNPMYASLYQREMAGLLTEQDAFGLKDVITSSIRQYEKRGEISREKNRETGRR